MNDLKRAYFYLVAATIGLYLVVAGVGAAAWILNGNRVSEIQGSRLSSCRQTYEGIREVFKPFLRPTDKQTAQEKHDVKLFNETVDRLKRHCSAQIEAGH